MSIFDDMLEEHERIAQELHGYLPEEREKALRDVYGRSKDEFPWIDFGNGSENDDSDF